MLNLITSVLFLTLFFVQDAVLLDSALPKPSEALYVRADDNIYVNLVRGLFRPRKGKLLDYVSDIPCEVIETLENDAGEARKFVEQLKKGDVPSIIKEIPDEVLHGFKDVINIALSLPSEILDAAEAAATDAANVFNDIEDGSIIKDIENLPGVVVSDVTKGWADFTDELTDAWGQFTSDVECFFGDCPKPSSVRSCRAAATATTTSDDATATTRKAAQRTTQSLPQYTNITSPMITQSPPQSTITAILMTTQRSPQYTSSANTPSPAQNTVISNIASTRKDWAGLGILTTAIGVFVCALYL